MRVSGGNLVAGGASAAAAGDLPHLLHPRQVAAQLDGVHLDLLGELADGHRLVADRLHDLAVDSRLAALGVIAVAASAADCDDPRALASTSGELGDGARIHLGERLAGLLEGQGPDRRARLALQELAQRGVRGHLGDRVDGRPAKEVGAILSKGCFENWAISVMAYSSDGKRGGLRSRRHRGEATDKLRMSSQPPSWVSVAMRSAIR